MFGSKRLHGPWWLSAGAHLFIVLVAFEAETAEAWPWAFLAMAVVSFFAWAGNYRRYRQIHDLPTSRVASAAQGYTELLGRGRLLDDAPIFSGLSGVQCCWYRYEIEEKTSDNKWKTVETRSSTDHFLLVDDSGQCVIAPEGAEVLTAEHKTWTEGRRRYTEWLLMPGTVLYALGEFSTENAVLRAATQEREEIRQLIADWKSDQKSLSQRFDLDGDGHIDLKEWELARLQAVREVRASRVARSSGQAEGLHRLERPRDKRLFLLANEMPDELGQRYRRRSILHLVILFATGLAGFVLLGFR